MKKNRFSLIFFFVRIAICFYLSIGFSFAATLKWTPVESTERCTIKGYKVYYGTEVGEYPYVVDVGNATSYNLDLLSLKPTQAYFFSVSAYSSENLDGPLSHPVFYRDSPNIVEYPAVDHINGIINVTFSESKMLGADAKANYLFSPAIPFDTSQEILQEDQTYRLFMSYIPEHTIFTMTVSNVTDSKGNALFSDSIILNDDDSDRMADDWESDYGVVSAFLDADSDGLYNRLEYITGTNPVDPDTDGDGMNDGWEVQNSLDPLLNDAAGDIDGDGILNIEEYNDGSSISNRSPEMPVCVFPVDSVTEVSLIPELKTGPYIDQEGDAHEKSQWQISSEPTFTIPEKILFEIESYESLVSLSVPEYILEPKQTYFWRVRFFDIINGRSQWAEVASFKTASADAKDLDRNGVPDNLQITDGTVDLNSDGSLDEATDIFKLVSYKTLPIGVEGVHNVSSVLYLKTLDPMDIKDSFGKPPKMEHGLLQFKLQVNNPGDAADIKVYFSETVGSKWYKYDLTNGWREYSADYPDYVKFSSSGKSVRLRLVDGGPGDADGVANGIIVDPSGPGVAVLSNPVVSRSNSGSASGGGGGGCFIATAAFGSPIEKHVQVLKDFRDHYLLKFHAGEVFVRAYYKYSPPVADFIAGNNVLRFIVRLGLMPLIAFGYVLVHMSFGQQACIVLTFIFLTVCALKIYRLRFYKNRPDGFDF